MKLKPQQFHFVQVAGDKRAKIALFKGAWCAYWNGTPVLIEIANLDRCYQVNNVPDELQTAQLAKLKKALKAIR